MVDTKSQILFLNRLFQKEPISLCRESDANPMMFLVRLCDYLKAYFTKWIGCDIDIEFRTYQVYYTKAL